MHRVEPRQVQRLPQDRRPLRERATQGSPDKAAGTVTQPISPGEAQRLRIATQLRSGLFGVVYVLDEPSIGLHAQDNEKLIGTLQTLRSKGNTLLDFRHNRGRDPPPHYPTPTTRPPS